jgi:hypothetical protein
MMKRRFLLTLVGLGALVAAGGMAQAARGDNAADPAGRTGRTMAGPAPIDAALVTAAFGWVLTPDELLLTRDGGATFDAVKPPVPAGDARAARFRDAHTGLVVAAVDNVLTVARTGDGGRTWRTTAVDGPVDNVAGFASLSLSFAASDHVAVLARVATSQAFSVGVLFASTDGGASWTVRAAPEAGRVGVDAAGRIWLAGSALAVTSDQGGTWTTPKVNAPVEADAVATYSVPVDGVLPVTVTTGDTSAVDLYATPDGGLTWERSTRLPVRARTGAGVRLPVVRAGAGPVVFDTVGGHAYRGTDGTDLRPTGLPDGAQAVSFPTGGPVGWTLAVHGTCARGKEDCVLHYDLVMTADAAAHWHPVAAWQRPVG